MSHAVFGGSLAHAFGPRKRSVLVVAGFSAMLPDADVVFHFAGVPYAHMFGHRGFTHSIFFAALWAVVAVATSFRREVLRGRIALFVFLATLSHPLYDMLTNGGLGCAIFAPFSAQRYFFPVRPIAVAPIGVHGLLSERGLHLLGSELMWVIAPSVAMLLIGRVSRGKSA